MRGVVTANMQSAALDAFHYADAKWKRPADYLW